MAFGQNFPGEGNIHTIQSAVNTAPIAMQPIVTAQQMQQIEAALFEAGMPVAALMEKVAGRVARWVMEQYPRSAVATVGIIVGPGHNGGDALVVARELHHQGYSVLLWCPFSKVKDLTAQHQRYLTYLGVRCTENSDDLSACDLIIDGGFGVGLTRSLEGAFAEGIDQVNALPIPVVSIDLPSGLETDSGSVLGTALRADHTLCLGLWKLGLMQDQARSFIGQRHLIPFDIPETTVRSLLAETPPVGTITPAAALSRLPLPRSPIAHKYKAGHLLIIAGSRQYGGAALLTGKGALASGVGMVTLVVPDSLRMTITSQIPEALVVGTAETDEGAIASLPDSLAWDRFDTVACGPGLTPAAFSVVEAVMNCDRPLVLDADGLNILAQHDPSRWLSQRQAPTLLTPHPGEFARLFGNVSNTVSPPSVAAQQAAKTTGATLLLKGATTAIAHPDGQVWFNLSSTPALARGGSGDVLTGLTAGLAAQPCHHQSGIAADHLLDAAIAAVWWHAQTGRHLANQRTELGCAASQLADSLLPVLGSLTI